MNQLKRNHIVRGELDELLRLGILSERQADSIRQRYPISAWDFRSLARWFLWFGALIVAASSVVLVHDHLHPTVHDLLVALAVLFAILVGGSLRVHRHGRTATARALQFLAGLILIGWSFALATLFDDGSGNWPKVLLFDLIGLIGMTYALNNPILLLLSALVFFVWFGGVTGYISGWGAYFFGMNYPLRFMMIGWLMIAFGFSHLEGERGPLSRYRGFAKVWISAGLFFSEMSLWLLSIFGNFGDMHSYRHVGPYEIALFNILWAGLNATLMYFGNRYVFRMLVGYGATFGIIQLYTLFFHYFAAFFGSFLSFLLVGLSALWLGKELEQRRRERKGRSSGTGVFG